MNQLKKVALSLLFCSCTSPVSNVVVPEGTGSDMHTPPFVESDLRKTRENKIGQWIYPPNVILCSDSPIKRQRLEDAMTWWTNLGYRFGSLQSDVSGGDCISEKPMGKIIVTLITQDLWDTDHFGKTVTTHHKETGNIYYSKVYFFYSTTPARVVRHEIGHSLGIGHYNRTGHIMHSSWSRGGLRTDGLEKK
jgi:hypothetical protein